jgi:hypothetical protein
MKSQILKIAGVKVDSIKQEYLPPICLSKSKTNEFILLAIINCVIKVINLSDSGISY